MPSPGGKGDREAVDEEWRHLTIRNAVNLNGTDFPIILFTELQTNSEHIAVPHPPQCAHWGTFPPGEGIALRYLYKFQFIGQLRITDMHIIFHCTLEASAGGGCFFLFSRPGKALTSRKKGYTL